MKAAGVISIFHCDHEGNIMERTRGVDLSYSGGEDPLFTLHRAEGLNG